MNKEILLNDAANYLKVKLEEVNYQLAQLNNDIASDTKSSMGDKFETSREMANIEINKLGAVKQKMSEDLMFLNSIKLNNTATNFGLGDLIETDKGIFFIAAPIGKISSQGKELMCISAGSPFGKVLTSTGRNAKEIEFNGKRFVIMNDE